MMLMMMMIIIINFIIFMIIRDKYYKYYNLIIIMFIIKFERFVFCGFKSAFCVSGCRVERYPLFITSKTRTDSTTEK